LGVTAIGENWGLGSYDENLLIENAKINPKGSGCKQVQSAKLLNPDLVGMGVLVAGSFSISRIVYLLDVYYTSYEVGCQVNFWPQRVQSR